MDLESIYKIEKFKHRDLDKVNLLLDHGWKLIEIGQDNFTYDIHDLAIGAETIFFVAATKSTFEKFNLQIYERENKINNAARNLAHKISRHKDELDRKKRIEEYGFDNDPFTISDDDFPF